MAFKLNIADKGKTWKVENDSEFLVGLSIGDKFEGKELGGDFDGYEFEIAGGSDIAGFPMSKNAEGIGLKRVLFTKGWGMWDNRKGIRLRKTVRGKTISEKIVQINLRVLKEGGKRFNEIFPEQNVKAEAPAEEVKPEEPAVEEAPKEEVKEESKEEVKEEAPAEEKKEEAPAESKELKAEEFVEDKEAEEEKKE